MSKIYKLSLKLNSGLLSELQSDTIFGHFCWRFKETLGEKKLTEFLDLYLSGNPVFTLSDGIFEMKNELFFPKPLLQAPYIIESKNKHDRIKNFLEQKESKDKKLITIQQLNLYLNDRIDEYQKSFADDSHSKLKYPSFINDIRVNVQIDRETLSAANGQLFSTSPMYIKDGVTIAILIKVINEKYFDDNKLKEIIKLVFTTGYGRKKSSGYGDFDVINYSEVNSIKEPNDSNGFIILGNYLPANDDKISDAYYDTNVKYGRLGEEFSHSSNPFKKPILFLTAGSCFFTDNKKEFYGRCTTKGEISDYKPIAIQNGMPLTLKLRRAD